MSEATFTFRVDEELKAAFAETARAQDRTAAQLLRTLMRDAVREREQAAEYDRWFRGEVEQALREAADPAIERVPHEVVKVEAEQEQAEWAARIVSEDRAAG